MSLMWLGTFHRQPNHEFHVVLEDGHPNAEDARRNYKWVRDRLPQAQRALAGLTFSDKTELPLAAADHFAYNAWGDVVGQKPIASLGNGPNRQFISWQRGLG